MCEDLRAFLQSKGEPGVIYPAKCTSKEEKRAYRKFAQPFELQNGILYHRTKKSEKIKRVIVGDEAKKIQGQRRGIRGGKKSTAGGRYTPASNRFILSGGKKYFGGKNMPRHRSSALPLHKGTLILEKYPGSENFSRNHRPRSSYR